MKLLVDMNLSPEWIPFLTEHGIEAVHWSTVGPGNAADAVIFEHARARGWVVFTHDLDFTTMLALAHAHRPSVVQARAQNVAPDVLGPMIVAALRKFPAELENGAIVTILPDRNKVQILPN